MKIVTIVGARPQFIKAAPLSRALRQTHCEILVHTGQHFDDNMSAIFFRELDIPQPDVHLGCGGGSHATQTAAMLIAIEKILIDQNPDRVLVYGDTNSTLAGALSAAKCRIPIIHVEAGLRSFNRAMPEEINRVITDHLSETLLCPGPSAATQLAREGVEKGVHVVGDVMADTLLRVAARGGSSATVTAHGLTARGYALATIHRAENTDDPIRLASILAALGRAPLPALLPIHPRTRKAIERHGLTIPGRTIICEPFGYLEMVQAIRDARMVVTDSGGLQKEAYWLGIPCITLRQETEWTETVEAGWNRLTGCSTDAILEAIASTSPPAAHPDLYGGDGHAAERCLAAIEH